MADGFDAMTCVVSVEKRHDGSCGTIRIVTGNRKFLDSIERALNSADERMYMRTSGDTTPNTRRKTGHIRYRKGTGQ